MRVIEWERMDRSSALTDSQGCKDDNISSRSSLLPERFDLDISISTSFEAIVSAIEVRYISTQESDDENLVIYTVNRQPKAERKSNRFKSDLLIKMRRFIFIRP